MSTSVTDIFASCKGVFFDMDGVLYDSMGAHAEAWHKAFDYFGIEFPRERVYQNEGRTAQSTIDLVYQQREERNATAEEVDQIYNKKTELIADFPDALPFTGALKLMEWLQERGVDIWVVTGSSQDRYLEALLNDFQGLVKKEKIISGRDVSHGKPHPEPYLKALEHSGWRAEEVIVVENAPLGIRSAKGAGLFTLAVNTGILSDAILWEAGADKVISDLNELFE